MYRNWKGETVDLSASLEVQGLETPPIPWTRYHNPSSTYMFVAHRKPCSRSWIVPEDDRELLEGVGANGTNSRKTDEGFELMLLMDLVDVD